MMLVDVTLVNSYHKPYADSTLNNMKKSELIEYVRMLEYNYNVAVSFNHQQAKNVKKMLDQKWIPVSERLPQEDEPKAAYCDTVQVLLKSGEVTVGWCNRHFGLWYHLPIGETYFVDADYEHTPVVAWQPLAEPPKECE